MSHFALRLLQFVLLIGGTILDESRTDLILACIWLELFYKTENKI